MLIKSPNTQQEWNQYYDLRWRILRAPWQQAKGSEQDDLESDTSSFHAMAIDDQSNAILGVARLNLLPNSIAQIRFMAVDTAYQQKGTGSQLLHYLENLANENKAQHVILQARENAVDFYLKNGYKLKEKSFLLWGEIQHFLMEKPL